MWCSDPPPEVAGYPISILEQILGAKGQSIDLLAVRSTLKSKRQASPLNSTVGTTACENDALSEVVVSNTSKLIEADAATVSVVFGTAAKLAVKVVSHTSHV